MVKSSARAESHDFGVLLEDALSPGRRRTDEVCVEAHLVPLIQVGNQELADLATRSYYRTKTFVLTNEIGRQRSVDPGHFMGLRYPARAHLHCIRHLYIQFKTGFELRRGSATLEDMLLETRFSLRYLLRSRKELDLSKVPHSQSSYQNHPGWRAPNNVVDTRWQDAFPCLEEITAALQRMVRKCKRLEPPEASSS